MLISIMLTGLCIMATQRVVIGRCTERLGGLQRKLHFKRAFSTTFKSECNCSYCQPAVVGVKTAVQASANTIDLAAMSALFVQQHHHHHPHQLTQSRRYHPSKLLAKSNSDDGAYSNTIDELLSRNKIWVESMKENDATFFERLGKGQKPQFLYFGCSDRYCKFSACYSI